MPEPLTALFGGTFDPVHFGHLRTAWEVREQLAIETFRFVPAGQPPHRAQPVTAARHRLAMLSCALEGWPGAEIDRQEIDRSGPSFMVDTLRACRSTLGAAPLLLVVGEDSAATLDSWHRWRELLELAHLVVMRRPGPERAWSSALSDYMGARRAAGPAELRACAAGCWLPVEVTPLAISSSAIRALLVAGRSARYLAPESVLNYIRRHELYRSASA